MTEQELAHLLKTKLRPCWNGDTCIKENVAYNLALVVRLGDIARDQYKAAMEGPKKI